MNNKSLETLIREELARARAAKAGTVDNMVLSLAKQVAAAVEEEAARIGVNAVVAISDRAARPVLVHVMEDACELVDGRFYVAGRLDDSLSPRKDMQELLEGIDRNKYVVVIDHQPNDYDAEADSEADLVVSGHTHGGQMIPFTKAGEWTGA